jgi:26S proteasome regulatory subunit N5
VQDANNTNLDASIESLLNVEKQMRLGGDVAGTRKAAIDIVELCFKAGAWKTLNDQIVLLSKRRGQLKQVQLLLLSCCLFELYV